MTKKFEEIFTEERISEVAGKLIQFYPKTRIFAFYGAMGVGKTTMIKAVCKQLKTNDTVDSPTFSIINQYLTEEGNNIYHFDFYRLKKIEEAYDIGYEDYFFSGNYCFIEWPEKIEELLPDDCCRVMLTEQEGVRHLKVLEY
ncbi:MAG: tRNA (adenosine(37)-N6)-threonylcarbamoyltransferase complex ATPase subunit type 1 TsaE [Bacteroidales bacterium]